MNPCDVHTGTYNTQPHHTFLHTHQVAIRVMVESFISTQKYSLQRELQRSLRRFIVLPSDYHAVSAASSHEHS